MPNFNVFQNFAIQFFFTEDLEQGIPPKKGTLRGMQRPMDSLAAASRPDSPPPLPPPTSALVPTSAEESNFTCSLTNTMPGFHHGPTYGLDQQFWPPVLPPTGQTTSSGEGRQVAGASAAAAPPRGAGHSSPTEQQQHFLGSFERQEVELEADLVPEGHLEDLARLLATSPTRINQSVNKYFML